MWPHDAHMGWMWFAWPLGIVLLIVLVWALARAAAPPAPPGGEESAEAILKRRYARGEIDDQEYQRRLRELRK